MQSNCQANHHHPHLSPHLPAVGTQPKFEMMQREKEIDDAGARHSALVEEENVCDCSTNDAACKAPYSNRKPLPNPQGAKMT